MKISEKIRKRRCKYQLQDIMSNREKGITLIALVITIIVLLILAGVTIATLTGENGIITRVVEASEETEKANLIEQVQMDILEKQAENQDGSISKEEFKEILEKYFDNVPEELPDDLADLELIAKEEYGGQTIEIAEIWNGTFEEEKEYIGTTSSYAGYYADIDGDGNVDGIVYADLAVGGSGEWSNTNSWGIYEYSAVTSGLKNYYVSQTGYEGIFGTKDVLVSEGNGTDRFYVMALEDINVGTSYSWYDAAYGQLDNAVETSANDFGQGKENTAYVLAKWKAEEWGTKNDNETYQDLWGEIEEEINEGWFVPSKSEWSAFGGNLGVTSSNYETYGLSGWYWSSSQYKTYSAYVIGFANNAMGHYYVNGDNYVRLSTTF